MLAIMRKRKRLTRMCSSPFPGQKTELIEGTEDKSGSGLTDYKISSIVKIFYISISETKPMVVR
jgi:hypothetical protein